MKSLIFKLTIVSLIMNASVARILKEKNLAEQNVNKTISLTSSSRKKSKIEVNQESSSPNEKSTKIQNMQFKLQTEVLSESYLEKYSFQTPIKKNQELININILNPRQNISISSKDIDSEPNKIQNLKKSTQNLEKIVLNSPKLTSFKLNESESGKKFEIQSKEKISIRDIDLDTNKRQEFAKVIQNIENKSKRSNITSKLETSEIQNLKRTSKELLSNAHSQNTESNQNIETIQFSRQNNDFKSPEHSSNSSLKTESMVKSQENIIDTSIVKNFKNQFEQNYLLGIQKNKTAEIINDEDSELIDNSKILNLNKSLPNLNEKTIKKEKTIGTTVFATVFIGTLISLLA